MGLVASVVHPVSALPAGVPTAYTNTDIAYDYAIGGLPFMSGASNAFPLQRQTADYKKDQIDQSSEPGEQSLVGWWLRSQASFHAGTGIVYEEPISSDATIQYRFQDSAGVDPWTAGHVTLLKSVSQSVASAGSPMVMGLVDGTADRYVLADGQSIQVRSDTGLAATLKPTPAPTGVLSMTTDGTYVYYADAAGIYRCPTNGTTGIKSYPTGSSSVTIGWVKQRLMAGIGNSIYELTAPNTTHTALPSAVFGHSNSSWVWTAITESPQAIYAAGYAGGSSAIFMFVLDNSGAVPTLTSGILAAEMPEGEIIYSVKGYLGSYLAIGTNKGVRIADVQADGTLQYGPLSVVLPDGAGPVRCLAGEDRFVFGGYSNAINASSGLFRIDLGTTVGLKQFAYASDLQAHTPGDVTSLALYGASGRKVFTVKSAGTYIESASALEPSGYMTTGNIRFHILEPKLFKLLRVWTKLLSDGGITISTLNHAGVETPLVTFTAGHANDPLDEVAFPSSYGPQEYVALKIGLVRSTLDTSKGPTVTGYQIKALPAQKRQRLYQIPLLCFDKETDRNGNTTGYEGSALARLRALEELEETGDVFRFDDLTRDPDFPRLVVIDGLQFVQTTPPKGSVRGEGWGGIIVATLRTVT